MIYEELILKLLSQLSLGGGEILGDDAWNLSKEMVGDLKAPKCSLPSLTVW